MGIKFAFLFFFPKLKIYTTCIFEILFSGCRRTILSVTVGARGKTTGKRRIVLPFLHFHALAGRNFSLWPTDGLWQQQQKFPWYSKDVENTQQQTKEYFCGGSGHRDLFPDGLSCKETALFLPRTF